MRYFTPFLFAVLSSPAWAASGPFVSLKNTNFIVLLAFVLFLAVLVYLKVPAMMGKLLDQRAEGIQADLDQARLLREEAQGILAEYERKQKEVQEQADRIVEAARAEAASAAAQGKACKRQSNGGWRLLRIGSPLRAQRPSGKCATKRSAWRLRRRAV